MLPLEMIAKSGFAAECTLNYRTEATWWTGFTAGHAGRDSINKSIADKLPVATRLENVELVPF